MTITAHVNADSSEAMAITHFARDEQWDAAVAKALAMLRSITGERGMLYRLRLGRKERVGHL